MTVVAAPARRIAALDVVRGVSILGTLGTNVWLFTDPDGPAGSPTGTGVVEDVLRALTNGKFLALLTLLFGVGLELQYRSARRRGLRWPGRYLRRCALLAVEGVLHYMLVFEYDVLFGYALAAVVVSVLVGRSGRVRATVAVGLGAVHLAVITAGTVASMTVPGAFGGPVLPGAGPVYASGSWADQVALRLAAWPVFRVELLLVVPLAVVLFLAGSALFRRGFLGADEAGARMRRRATAIGLGVALPVDVALAVAGPSWFLLERYVVAPVVALGLLAAITSLVHRADRVGPVQRALTDVGRHALGAYVLQNVLASVLCYGWGLGLAGRIAELPAGLRPSAVVGVWVVVVLVVRYACGARERSSGSWQWFTRVRGRAPRRTPPRPRRRAGGRGGSRCAR